MQSHYFFRIPTLCVLFLVLLSVHLQAQRVSDDIEVLFHFGEGQGDFVVDHSQTGVPLLLKLDSPQNCSWLPNGGLSLDNPTRMTSLSDASAMTGTIQNTGEISMEAWINPANLSQNGPARILTCSGGSTNRNFMLGQDGGQYIARVRTDQSNDNGTPNFSSGGSSVHTQLQHVVYTLDNSGNEKFYIDGELKTQGQRPGSIANFDESFKFAIGNEFGANREWEGEIFLAAVYSRSLTESEVVQNFNTGLSNGGAVADATCPEDCWIDGFGNNNRVLWIPNLPNNINLEFLFDDNGGNMDTFDDGRAHVYGNMINVMDPSIGFYIDVWFENRMNWDEWSALGRSWKGNPTTVGNNYLDWDYYIVDASMENVLIGTGGLEGSLLNLTHKPSNYNFGFQVGLAANDQNANYGMSCWFYCTGQVLGVNHNDHCDINMEGECNNTPAFACAVDVEVDCDLSLDPEFTGSPVLYCPLEYTLTYNDEWTSTDCPASLVRTWTATDSNGDTIVCEQLISVVDNQAPTIQVGLSPVVDCSSAAEAFSVLVDDNCDDSPSIEVNNIDVNWLSSEACEPGMYRTQTPGGWGATPNGNNPGAYLHANFDQAFPNGLTIGCDNQLVLTSAQAVTDFLPSGTTPTTLPDGIMTNPGSTYNNVFAGHLVALSLSAGFDAYDANFGSGSLGLGNLSLDQGEFAGWTISQLLEEANNAIGGCGSAYSFSALSGALASVNENFVDGTMDGGAVDCGFDYDCAAMLTATVTATDACGNSSTATASVIVVDTTAPSMPDLEQQITVNCGEIPAPIETVANECEWSSSSITLVENEFSGACNTSIERVYTVVDQCGNETVFTQYIAVVDTEDPVFVNVPQSLSLNCGELIPLVLPTAEDNCDEDVLVTYADQMMGEGCDMQILRIFTAEDNCGNTAVAQQIIDVSDTSAPVIEGENLLTLSCDDNIPSTEPTVSDDCDANPELTMFEEVTVDGCTQTLNRTWTATDACGNSSIFAQVIVISDNEAPIFMNFPADESLSCNDEATLVIPEAFDNCGNAVVTWSEQIIDSEDFCSQILRTFTASDDCGNTTAQTQIFTLIDIEAPTLLNVPASGVFNCSDLSDAGAVTASDNCDQEIEINVDEIWVGEACAPQLIRTWTAIDNCGNTATATQIVDLVDDNPPVFVSAPANLHLTCGVAIPEAQVVVEDACSQDVNVDFSEEQIGSGCAYTINRTWTATDACGNQSTHIQVITINDDQAPQFANTQANLNLSCGEIPVLTEPIVSDNCSVPTLEYTESEMTDDCGVTTFRTWTATDDCGNSASYTQTIFVGDFEAPVLSAIPASLTIDCSAVIPDAMSPIAEDQCSAVDISLTEAIVGGSCASNYTLIRTWTATDLCGNSSVAIQTVSVTDTTAPVFDLVPDNITVDCGSIPEPPVLTATDNCSNVTVSFEEVATEGGCPNLLRTWTATDDCGNSSSVMQTVFVEDAEPPLLIGIPEDLTVSCNNIPDMPDPEASDNCDDDVAVTASINIIGTGCEYTIVRTWIAEDDCGNTTIESQSINVIDEAPPVFVAAPADVTVECSQLEGLPLPEVLDDCGATVNISFSDQQIGANNCEFDILRTYIAADQCGNTAVATQNIHVVDNSPPQFIGVPPNQFVSCGNIPDPANVEAVDACSGVVSLDFVEQVFGDDCDYYIQRVWTAIDGCGNSASIAHLVYVTDSQAPVVQGAGSITVDCTDAWPTPQEPTVTDDCSANPSLNLVEFNETNDCSEILTRIWIATDNCGNTSSTTQLITRADITAPVITGVPATVTVDCSAIPDPALVSATDNCSANVSIDVNDVYLGGACPYTIMRTWTATDDCGNSSIATQEILVIDNEAPMLFDLPMDMTVECSAVPGPQFPSATDNCLAEVNMMVQEEWSNLEDCSYLLIRTYTATDLCGNTSSHVQTITVLDTQAPMFPQLAEEVFVQCDEVPAFEMIIASDNCDPNVTVCMNETQVQGDCPTEQMRIRVWTAVDACGNTASFTQTVIVEDHNLPSLIGVPGDVTVSCAEIPEVPTVMGWDPCQGDLPVSFEEEVSLVGESSDACALGNAVSPAGEVAIWLPTLNGFASDYVFGDEMGSLTEDPATGTALVTGVVYNPANANQGWIIEMHLENARDWTAWSALGRGFKDDLGLGAPYHEEWTYYEIDNTTSRLIGIGEFDGAELSLAHAPTSYYYGVQIGLGANNRNGEYGMSGWFNISGMLNGAQVAGMGDIMTTNNCCPDQVITRTWTVVDCAGNTVSYTQTITVTAGFAAPTLLAYSYSEEGEFDVTGTEDDEFMLAFRLPETGQISIEMYDLGGNMVKEIFSGNVIKNAEYRIPVSKSGMVTGMYIFRLAGSNFLLSDKDMKVLN